MNGRSLNWIDWLAIAAIVGSLYWLLFVAETDGADPAHIVTRVYSASDCRPCQRMKAEFKLAKLSVEFVEDEVELKRMKITATPTTMIFVEDKRVWRKVGYISVQTMKAKLAEYRDK